MGTDAQGIRSNSQLICKRAAEFRLGRAFCAVVSQ
jgi:hypothetical protein